MQGEISISPESAVVGVVRMFHQHRDQKQLHDKQLERMPKIRYSAQRTRRGESRLRALRCWFSQLS